MWILVTVLLVYVYIIFTCFRASSVFIYDCFNLLQLNSIADRTITEADTDGDFMISFDEFAKVQYFM